MNVCPGVLDRDADLAVVDGDVATVRTHHLCDQVGNLLRLGEQLSAGIDDPFGTSAKGLQVVVRSIERFADGVLTGRVREGGCAPDGLGNPFLR